MLHGNVKLSNLGKHDKVFFELKQACPVGKPFLLSQRWLPACSEVHLLPWVKRAILFINHAVEPQIFTKSQSLFSKKVLICMW